MSDIIDAAVKEVAKVISLEEIIERARGIVIEIPDWAPNAKIGVRVKAIDMTPHMLSLEKMPNALRAAADEVFNGKQGGKKDSKLEEDLQEAIVGKLDISDVEQIMPILEGIAKEVLVEPTYDEIQAVYPLTLAQKMALFQFAMGGVDKLESFR